MAHATRNILVEFSKSVLSGIGTEDHYCCAQNTIVELEMVINQLDEVSALK